MNVNLNRALNVICGWLEPMIEFVRGGREEVCSMYKMQRVALAAAAAIGAAVLWAPAANAVTISIGFCASGCPTVFSAGSASGSYSASGGSLDTFNFTSATGTGNPPLLDPELLQSGTIDVASTGPGILKVFVTASGISGPLSAALNFVTSFTAQNNLGTGWTVALQSFISPTNTVFDVTTPLSSVLSLTALGTASETDVGNTGGGPFYAITEVFTITAPGAGQANLTGDVSTAAPLPGALPLFASGLGAMGLLGWRRKKRKAAAAAA